MFFYEFLNKHIFTISYINLIYFDSDLTSSKDNTGQTALFRQLNIQHGMDNIIKYIRKLVTHAQRFQPAPLIIRGNMKEDTNNKLF